VNWVGAMKVAIKDVAEEIQLDSPETIFITNSWSPRHTDDNNNDNDINKITAL
jgi:hypothetical protein